MEKIPKISEDLIEIIDQHNSETYNKGRNRTKHQIEHFALYRKNGLKEMLQQPDKYHPIIYKLLSAESGADIMDILNGIDKTEFDQEESIEEDDEADTKYVTPTIHQIYGKAIRCCADLDEIPLCWKIFERCKKDKIISNELYCTMMWVCMYKKRTRGALDRIFQLNEELEKAKTDYNLKIHPRTYSTLINSCAKVKNYDKGIKILRDIERNHPELLGYTRFIQAATKLLVNVREADKALDIIESKAKSDETVWYQFKTYELSLIIRRIGLGIKYGKMENMERAEQLFQKCVAVACRHNVDIPASMFNAIMKVYAQNEDYDSCLVLLKYMIHPEKKHKNFPSPSISSFEIILEALEHHENGNDKWEKVDKMLMAMKKLEIDRTWNFYCRLFDVCGDDIERAKKWYQEMIDVDKIQPNMAVLKCFFSVAESHYQHNDPEFQAFMKYIIDQHSEYGVIPTQEIKDRWTVALQGSK